MKTYSNIQLSTLCIYFLYCVNLNLVFSQQETPKENLAESFLGNNETTTNNFLKLLQKAVEHYKSKNHTLGTQGRQDEDDDDFEIPSYVPQIIKIVGSVLAGNASSVVDNSLSLIPGGSSGQIGAQVGNIIEILSNTISQSQLRIPTKPPRTVSTRRPTRRPPMSNRTRRTTTSRPVLNQVMKLNSTAHGPNSPITSRPIIFVLPNFPNGVSASEVANNPNFLELVVNQSLSALHRPVNNVPISNQKPNTSQSLLPHNPSIDQPANNLAQPPNPGAQLSISQNPKPLENKPTVVSSNENFTVIAQNQKPGQEELLSNLLNILTQLAQPTTTVSPASAAVPINGSISAVPQVPLTQISTTVATTTEDEYYYYEDEETTKAPQKGGTNTTESVIAVTTTTSGDDDDEDGAVIKDVESNQNITKVSAVETKFTYTRVTTPFPKVGAATVAPTVKPQEKDPEEEEDEDEDSSTTKKPSVNKVIVTKAPVTKIPVIENDEEEAAAAITYPPVKSKLKTTPRVSVSIQVTTEENEDEDDDDLKTAVKKINKIPSVKSSTLANEDGDDEAKI